MGRRMGKKGNYASGKAGNILLVTRLLDLQQLESGHSELGLYAFILQTSKRSP